MRASATAALPVVPDALSRAVLRWRPSDDLAVDCAKRALLGVSASERGVRALIAGDAILVVVRAVDDVTDERNTRAALSALGPLEPGALVFVVADAPASTGMRRWLGGRVAPLSRAIVGSALLLEGFGEIGAGRDAKSKLELVWGRARGDA